MNKLLGAVATIALLGVADQAHAARDYVWAAGSSTVFPFSTRVAENYSKKTGKKSPKIESLGTGGGIKMFCGGTGEKFPDIANASRPMKKSEFQACQKAGVKDIVEIKIGFDGIVVASDKKGPDFNFKLEQLYLGLADQTLRGGQLVKQPYKNWNEVGPNLPKARILAYGPPPTSGTRDAWIELGIEGGAGKLPSRRPPAGRLLRLRELARFRLVAEPQTEHRDALLASHVDVVTVAVPARRRVRRVERLLRSTHRCPRFLVGRVSIHQSIIHRLAHHSPRLTGHAGTSRIAS